MSSFGPLLEMLSHQEELLYERVSLLAIGSCHKVLSLSHIFDLNKVVYLVSGFVLKHLSQKLRGRDVGIEFLGLVLDGC